MFKLHYYLLQAFVYSSWMCIDYGMSFSISDLLPHMGGRWPMAPLPHTGDPCPCSTSPIPPSRPSPAPRRNDHNARHQHHNVLHRHRQTSHNVLQQYHKTSRNILQRYHKTSRNLLQQYHKTSRNILQRYLKLRGHNVLQWHGTISHNVLQRYRMIHQFVLPGHRPGIQAIGHLFLQGNVSGKACRPQTLQISQTGGGYQLVATNLSHPYLQIPPHTSQNMTLSRQELQTVHVYNLRSTTNTAPSHGL